MLDHESYEIRRLILDISYHARVGHIGSALSVADIIAVLYFNALKPRDRFILSKGHAAAALYSALYLKKRISKRRLFSYCRDGGTLGVHPDYDPEHGIELTTGSLGHGLSVGCGMALGGSRTYVLISDAELNEGSCWEAVMFAAHHKLDNLTVIVDANGNQAFGKTADVLNIYPIAEKFRMFGWDAVDVDGHDRDALAKALKNSAPGKPKVIVAKTVAGYGVSFMEHKIEWHYWPMTDDQYRQALEEL